MDKCIQASGPSLSSEAAQAVDEGTANTRQSSNRVTIFKQGSNSISNNILVGGGGATSSAYKPESNSSIVPFENIKFGSRGNTTHTHSIGP